VGDEKRFRLRNDDKIAGYMRRLAGDAIFYSKDSFWWTGKPILYKQIDEWTGWRDKNSRHIFEWDIVNCKVDPDGEYQKGAVLWEQKSSRFTIKLLDEPDVYFPFEMDGLELFQAKQLEVVSFLFINPEIMQRLGVKDE
jgi:hypothetical protein